MHRAKACAAILVAVLTLATGEGSAAPPELPVMAGKATLATVNGEPITLEEFVGEFASSHAGIDNAATARTSPGDLLERMIDVRLVLQEARNIGLDELDEVAAAVESFEKDTLRSMLFGYHVRNIRTPDKKDVERRYREAVKEVKVSSVLLENEEAGKKLESQLRSGGDFRALAGKMVSDGLAKGGDEAQYMKVQALLPEVAKAISTLKKGQVSPLIRIGEQYTILRLDDVRFPKNPSEREKAEKETLQAKQVAALKAYVEGLKKRHVKVNRKLYDGLDYDAPEPGFEKLSEDRRVVAQVKGEEPVRVMDLTKALKLKFFHGTERAANEKKVNRKKDQVLEEILFKRVVLLEARRTGIDKTRMYKEAVEEYRRGILFGAFVQKVVDPDVRVDDEELKSHFEEHISEYTSPEMMRLERIVFSGREEAENALEKLRRGADFQWVGENADGRADPGSVKNLLEFGTAPLVTATLPEGVRKALSGSASGEFRLYADPGGPAYVLHVVEVIPPAPQAYEDARGGLARRVFAEKREKALKDWMGKLRAASEVKVFASGDELERAINSQFR